MSGLVSYLSHEDEKVEVASEAVNLATGHENRKQLYAQSGLVSALTKLTGSQNYVLKQTHYLL